MAHPPKKPNPNRRPPGTKGKRPPPGNKPGGPRPAKPGQRPAKGKVAKTQAGKQAGKQAGPAKRPNTPAYHFGSTLVLSLLAMVVAAYGLAVVNQSLIVSITQGRDAVAMPAITITGGLLGGFIGLITAWLLVSRAKWLRGSLVALLLTGGLAFAGQMLLPGSLEQNFTNAAPVQKQAALRTAFVHQSAAAGALQVEGLPTDLNSLETRSFVAGLGALGTWDPSLYERLDSNIDRLANTIMARGLTEEQAWRRFQESVAQTQRDFERYRGAADKVLNVRNNVDQEAIKLWEAVNQSAEARWVNYQQRRSRALTQLNARLPEFRDLLSVYFRVRQRGADMGEMEARYRRVSNDLFGQYVDPQTWCGLSGCPGTLDYITEVSTQALSQAFAQNSGGLSLDLDEQAFYEHPRTRQQLRDEIAVSGVSLPANWAVSARGRIDLIEAARRDLPVNAEIQYNTTIDDWFATTLSPDLGYGDFIAQEGIQQLLRASLKLPIEIRIDPTVDRASFAQDYYPRIERPAVDALAADMQAPLDDFAQAARLTNQAEIAMTTASAIPLAMFAGGLAGFASLILAVALMALAVIRPLARFLRVPETTMKRINSRAGLGTGLAVALAMIAPFIMGGGVANYPGYPVLGQSVTAQPIIGMPSAWAMRMATALQPTGAFAQSTLLGDRTFGMDPIIETEKDGFGFAFEFDDSDPTLIEEPDRGPAGITGIRETLGNIIDRDGE
ncbi:MAG: hypothetical protein AAF213_12635 [Pseudomonadota bacterium]